MMIDLIKKYLEKPKFIDKLGNQIEYLFYHKKENMITIKTETGYEKIPVSGLDKI
jgi:hypothetical protein